VEREQRHAISVFDRLSRCIIVTAEEKLKLDLRDFWRIHDGLEVYASLDAKATMERLKAHGEDGLCTVGDYAGAGTLLCTRDGYLAIFELAERHRETLPVPDDYSVKELGDGIRSHIVRAMVEEKQDEPAVPASSLKLWQMRQHIMSNASIIFLAF
jgi:hypothetical protein